MPPGPLRALPSNPRWFTADGEHAILLAGSHNWAVLQDIGRPGSAPFPHDEWLGALSAWGHNFQRIWMFEQPSRASWTPADLHFSPLPWARTGPGTAADGLPRFDLATFEPAYFERLRARVSAAGAQGIYCAVMLFQGWSLHKTGATSGDPWPVHPFNGANNINGVDAAWGGLDDDTRPSLHSLRNPAALAHQEAYVRKVLAAIGDLPNVLYEIINEGGATDWQEHMVRLIRSEEASRGRSHPIGMSARIAPRMDNRALFDSPADWVSPAKEPMDWQVPGSSLLQDYQDDPPPADGSKVVINDTDHLWGHGGNAGWVWKSFLRGLHPVFMDPWWPLYLDSDPAVTPWVFVGGVSKDQRDYPDWEPVRRALGDVLRLARRTRLERLLPRQDLASSRYCLADPGHEYVVYLPHGGPLTLDLRHGRGPFEASWLLPGSGRTFAAPKPFAGGDYAVTAAPVTGDAVLHLRSVPR